MKKLCIGILVLLFVFTIGFSQEKAKDTKKEEPKQEEVKSQQQGVWGLLPSHRAEVQELMAEFDQKMVAYITVIRVDMAAIGIQIPANVQLNYAKLQLELIPEAKPADEKK